MHMADALLAPGVAGVMYACSAVAAGRSVRKLNQQPDDKAVPVMGVMGAFVFAAQMINFTIPGTGSSGHLCGGMLLAAIVDPFTPRFLTMIGVLLIQCLLFADGGLMALGANIWNMAFYGCFVGGLIWRTFTRKGLNRAKIIAASLIGCILSLQLGAFSVSVETLASGITALPFGAFLLAMQPIHLAIGAVEGCITAAVLVFLYEARPSLLWQGRRGRRGEAAPDLTRHAGRAGGRGRGRRRRAFAAGICLPRWIGMVDAAFDRQHRTGNHRPRAGVFLPVFKNGRPCCRTTTLQAPTRLPGPARRASSARSWCWPW